MSVFSNKPKQQAQEDKAKDSADPLDGLTISTNRDSLLRSFSNLLREQLADIKKEKKNEEKEP